MMFRVSLCLYIVGLLMAVGCTEKIPPTLDEVDVKAIDSIVTARQDSIWKSLDAECEKVYFDYYDKALDSVWNKRLGEIEKINSQ